MQYIQMLCFIILCVVIIIKVLARFDHIHSHTCLSEKLHVSYRSWSPADHTRVY